MKRMILAKGFGAALALTLMAGFAGQASAGLREYCASYARDVANRKTNGGADALVGTIGEALGGTVLGAGVASNRYKRVYANAYDRCVANYEGTREPDATAQAEAPEQKITGKKVAASETTENEVITSEVTEKKVAASEATDKKVAASKVTEKKVAASVPVKKNVAANDALNKDKACARKYRSYDPQVGKYKSYGGKWRPCRL